MATVHGVAESDTTDRTSPARTWLVPEYWGLPRCSVIKNLLPKGDAGRPLGWGDALEEEMATYSSIHAWKIPWMEEPGRLQPTGLRSRI